MSNSEYIIYTRWLAVLLREQGFKILRTQVNQHHPQFDCYVFEDSSDFQRALAETTAARKKK